MKNISKLLLLFCFSLCLNPLLAQEPDDPGAVAEFTDLPFQNQKLVVPPSPNAASFGKFGEYEVSYYTGALNLSIPIHTLQGRNISHAVSLSYNGGGNIVEQVPSWAGLGWNLNAGGVISRTVQGNPDLDWNYYVNEPYEPDSLNCIELCHKHKLIEQNELETRPDLYQLNAGGITTTFILNPDKEIIKKSRDGLTIRATFAPTDNPFHQQGDIIAFEVRDQFGFLYYFNAPERSTYQLSDMGTNSYPHPYYFNSSWYLTEIHS